MVHLVLLAVWLLRIFLRYMASIAVLERLVLGEVC